MCGIAGIALRPGRTADPAILAALAKALAHRGPDGAGEFTAADAALVHTRLAIIDLATGDQPLHAGPLTLVANGEIYNFRELRAVLSTPHKTGSDCEPPLHLFARRAEHYADALRGMYAIAIHDAAFATLTLSRDPFGIKPLYIADTPAGFVFASEPSALLAAGLVRRAVDAAKLAELLNLQFCTGTATIYPGISRVAPGATLTIRDGILMSTTQLAAPTPPPPPAGEAEAVAALDAVLKQAVDLHQRSDVPYGMFLSGGVDSAVILAMMSRLNSRPVRAYTAGFDVPAAADEREAAAATAKAAGARHESINITKAMVWAHLPAIVAAMDDPAADYAIIPTWFLARHARGQVKVILSGEGGDEMFAGYGRYRAAARWFLPKPMRARDIFDGLDILRAQPHGWRAGRAASEAAVAGNGSRLRVAQRADIAEWLPNDLLLKLDRCLMAHGVEGRTPFVDPAIHQFAFSLPDKLLVRHGRGKYLLRLWLEQNLPAARPFAKKQGFDVPIGAWIADEPRLGPLVAAQPIIKELAKADRVPELFARAGEKRAGFAAWLLLFVALWHRHHILDLPPAGDIFATLAAR